MPSASELPRVLSSVVVVQQDETDWFLVRLDRGDSVAVDRAEARVFQSCQQGASFEAATSAVARELDAPDPEAADKRVRAALEHFREWGLCAL